MSFKQCFMKVFTIFSSFEVWYISPLNTWKQQDLGFACFQGGKTSKFKSRKNRLKSTFSHIFFYRTYYFGKRHDMKQCTTFKNHFLKNTCNLRHSNIHALSAIRGGLLEREREEEKEKKIERKRRFWDIIQGLFIIHSKD